MVEQGKCNRKSKIELSFGSSVTTPSPRKVRSSIFWLNLNSDSNERRDRVCDAIKIWSINRGRWWVQLRSRGVVRYSVVWEFAKKNAVVIEIDLDGFERSRNERNKIFIVFCDAINSKMTWRQPIGNDGSAANFMIAFFLALFVIAIAIVAVLFAEARALELAKVVFACCARTLCTLFRLRFYVQFRLSNAS